MFPGKNLLTKLQVVILLSALLATWPGLALAQSCPWGKFEAGIPFVGARQNQLICDWIQSADGGNPLGLLFRSAQIFLTVIVIMAGMLGMVWGGYIYMTAAGDANRVQLAKTWIGSALVGIALAVLSYLILREIHPAFVDVSSPTG